MVEIQEIARPLSTAKIIGSFVRWRAVDIGGQLAANYLLTSSQLAAKKECVLSLAALRPTRSEANPLRPPLRSGLANMRPLRESSRPLHAPQEGGNL